MARVPTRAEHARERLDALLAQVEAAREELDKIERTPEDEYALGSVLTWLRTWDSDQEYAYAAIKFYHAATGEDRWTVTGRTTITLRWHELWDVHLSRAVPGSLAWCSETTEVELP